LQRVEPTFDFIQLAARFPVRIVLRQADGTADESLRMGGRAAVVVDTRAEPKGVAPR
jgi:multidrug resistance efflux pump